MDNEFVLAPALVNVRFSLEPVANALQSLRLINDTEQLSGLDEWVTRTAAALSPERLYTNRLIFGAFEPLTQAVRHDVMGFAEFLTALEQEHPQRLLEAMNHDLQHLMINYPEMAAKFEQPAELKALLRDRAAYVRFMSTLEECSDDVLWNAAFDLAQDPAALQHTVVEHLRWMWDNHLREEWERSLPMLTESVAAFARLDFSNKTMIEAARIVTNRDLRDLVEKKLSSDQIVFVPSPHVGPYVSIHQQRGELVILFGARLPRGAQSPAQSEFTRAELLIRLNALADDTRLQILELLTRHDELYAQDIIERLGVSQSTVSRHLSQLRATGYIIERRREVAKYYSLNTDRVMDTLRALTNFLARQ